MSYSIELPFRVGDKVLDDLTGKEVEILGLRVESGRYDKDAHVAYTGAIDSYRVSNDYLDGLRHPWELSHTWETGAVIGEIRTCPALKEDCVLTEKGWEVLVEKSNVVF